MTALASQVTPGMWQGNWGVWTVTLAHVNHAWHVAVWHWTRGDRDPNFADIIGERDNVLHVQDAVSFACDMIRKAGPTVLVIDRPSIRLEDLLEFEQVPVSS